MIMWVENAIAAKIYSFKANKPEELKKQITNTTLADAVNDYIK